MAKYLSDGNDHFERQTEPKVTLSATEARQGRLGRPVLMVLVGSLILVVLAWGAAELWGIHIAPRDAAIDPATTSSTTADPLAGRDVIDNNQPAGEKIQAAPAIRNSEKM